MREDDLDQIIDKSRESIRALSNIDVEDKDSEVSIGRINSEIKNEALTLNIIKGKTPPRPKEFNSIDSNQNFVFKGLKKIDYLMQHIPLYKHSIRPRFRAIFDPVLTRRRINGKELLRYDGEQFITNVQRLHCLPNVLSHPCFGESLLSAKSRCISR
jgi:hypothetical protein